jgi:hypothetical protein
MRQGQQNRRGRGRNNQNNQQRKGQNPLTRSFESNGPDVKLRGTPAHIAEKYMSLARDAQSAGDPVLAENYLQHAEHYNRIIMAYREQVGQGEGGFNGGYNPQQRSEPGFAGEAEGEDSFDASGEQPMMPRQGGDQPRMPDVAGERRHDDRHLRSHGEHRHQQQPPRDRDRDRDRSFQNDRGGYDRRDRQDRSDRFDRGDRPDRGERMDRGDRQDRGDRPERSEQRMDRERPERFERPQQTGGDLRGSEPRTDMPPRRRERPVSDRIAPETHEQPEFLRRPVRRPRREDNDEGLAAAPAAVVAGSEDNE